MEARLCEVQWQRSEYRLWHDEEKSARRFDTSRAERRRISLTHATEELRRETRTCQELNFLVTPLHRADTEGSTFEDLRLTVQELSSE